MPFRNLPGVKKCSFQKGDYLITAGEKIDWVYYLVEGTVYRERTTATGYESILNSKTGNNVMSSLLGILIFYKREHADVSADDFIAKTDCVCYRIPKDVCMFYLREHPDLMEELVRCALDEYNKMMDLFQAKREGCVSGNLCKFLMEHSVNTEKGRLVPKKYTNVEIAKFLSVHKVTVARMIRVLKDEGQIERKPEGLYITNPEELQMYAEQKRSLDYK